MGGKLEDFSSTFITGWSIGGATSATLWGGCERGGDLAFVSKCSVEGAGGGVPGRRLGLREESRERGRLRGDRERDEAFIE